MAWSYANWCVIQDELRKTENTASAGFGNETSESGVSLYHPCLKPPLVTKNLSASSKYSNSKVDSYKLGKDAISTEYQWFSDDPLYVI